MLFFMYENISDSTLLLHHANKMYYNAYSSTTIQKCIKTDS